jgi:hypothetical protein
MCYSELQSLFRFNLSKAKNTGKTLKENVKKGKSIRESFCRGKPRGNINSNRTVLGFLNLPTTF